MPVWNAATRSGEGSFGGARSVFAIALHFFRNLERAGVDLAARPARQFARQGDCIFHAVISELFAQEIVERIIRECLRIRWRWADHEHELATRFQRLGLSRKLAEPTA